MKTRRFDFDYKPLQIQVSIAVSGSVAAKQNFDADTMEFSPDYTITPLVLQPNVGVIDKDEIVASGSINPQLANVKWYEIIDGTRTLIEATNADYVVTTNGPLAGRILVNKNAQPKHPITLEFSAEFTDPRNSQVYAITQTYLIQCTDSTSIPKLVLDAADQSIYNPLDDDHMQTIHARLLLGVSDCPTSNREFVWELQRDNGTWSSVGADSTLDYHISVSADSTSATIDRSLMGKVCKVRCRAKYDPYGNPSSIALSDASPSKMVTFIRRIPKYEYDIFDVPYNVPQGIRTMSPTAKIWNTKGVISNPERELLPIWYMVTNNASGSPSLSSSTQIGNGMSPTLKISETLISKTYGAVMGLDVVDRGAICAWTDSDGKVLTDGSGNVLLIH